MKKLTRCALSAILALVCGYGTAKAATAEKKPLKIYIMAGQSNMQGKARTSTIARMALSPESKDLHDKLVDKEGKPRVHENVYVAAVSSVGGKPHLKNGPLTIGFGSGLTKGDDNAFGTELAFGATLQENLDEPILIIKTSWGGKNLYRQFRPPSAGPPSPSAAQVKKWKEKGTYEEELAKRKENFKDGGSHYRLMCEHIHKVLADPGKYHPAYDKKAGYEIAGFVWFQGYNDAIAGSSDLYKATKSRPQYAAYTDFMAHFIRDVRKEVKSPNMPFVIGVMGIGGNTDGAFQKAQAAVAKLPEFKGNVAAVLTGKFWDHEMEKYNKKAEVIRKKRDRAHELTVDGKKKPAIGWQPVGTPAPEDREWRYMSISPEPGKTYEDRCEGFFHYIVTDDKLKDWYKPGFDDSSWKKGKAPIGTGTAWGKKHRKEQQPAVTPKSDWGDGDYLLARTTFEVDDLKKYERFRLSILARLGYIIYLNGQEINNYYWYHGPMYRTRKKGYTKGFGPDNLPLKKGTNVLAVYANAKGHGGMNPPVVIDVDIEGLTKEGAEKIEAYEDSIMPRREKIIGLAKSNAGFHYNGSAYTYSLIGEAFANAMLDMEK